MLYVIEFLLFLAYTVFVFFIKSYSIILLLAIFNIILMIILKENIKDAVINMIITGISYGILIGLRLIFVCNMTYIFSKKMTQQRLEYVIETLLKPLKILKIDSREIGIMLCIGIAFIPIIQREITQIKYSLNSKGFKINLINVIKKPNYILAPLITSVIKRVGEIENSLLSKGYVS